LSYVGEWRNYTKTARPVKNAAASQLGPPTLQPVPEDELAV